MAHHNAPNTPLLMSMYKVYRRPAKPHTKAITFRIPATDYCETRNICVTFLLLNFFIVFIFAIVTR